MFDPLTPADLTHIVDIKLARLNKRLADRRVNIDVTPEGEHGSPLPASIRSIARVH